MLPLLTVNTVTELLCFMIAAFCLFNEKNLYWKSFMYYMLTVSIVELLGIYLRFINLQNHNMYSIFLLVECVMISSFFYYLFSEYYKRPKILFIWLAIIVICLITELVGNKFGKFAYQTAAFMSVVFVIASLYFYLLVLRDEKFRKLSTDPQFWMVNGFLFFYFGSTACNVFFDYLLLDKISHSKSTRYIIFNILNVLLYSCWSYAFICRYRQRKFSSSLL